MPPDNPNNRWLNTRSVTGDDYDSTYTTRAAAGENVHGEADFVEAFHPKSALDAGCGTGRVGVELAHRGVEVVGVDIDANMLDAARRKAPHLDWRTGDISLIDLERKFDTIVMAGNVMIFLAPGTEGVVLRNMAHHLNPGGVLIAGFQLAMGYLELEEYDRLAGEAGLKLAERWSTWGRDAWSPNATYAVSLHSL